MPDVVNLISRVLLSSVFIVYGLFKFIDVSSITNSAGTKRHGLDRRRSPGAHLARVPDRGD